jgi:iron complex outermembrane receptor protein
MGSAVAQQTPVQQSNPSTTVDQTTVQENQPQQQGDRVVVTGSRIARDAFTSTAPIQVITSESAVLEGLVDTAEILQGSTMASGSVQINNSFGGFVIEGGTGVNTISLRGLGAQRSLVLLNGQRPGPAGTRGQVGAFDLNVVPDSIINRVEILKDGASSVYGSDAVAGVANIITRSSVDRPELTVQYNKPEDTGGESLQVNGAIGFDFNWGGSLMLAAEIESREALARGERKWASCNKDLVMDPATGNFIDREDRSILAGTSLGGCSATNIYFNTVIDAVNGLRYIPSPNGVTIGPFPGYRPRTNRTYLTSPDGQAYFEDVLNDAKFLTGDILSATDRYSVYGKYDQNFGSIEWTTEALFTRRETESKQWRQFFPLIAGPLFYDVPGPFTTPASFANAVPGVEGTELAQPVTIWPSNTDVSVDYYYINSGLNGDFGNLGFLSNWTWNLNASFSKSEGDYTRNQILKETAGDANFASADGLYRGPTYNPFDPAFLSGNYSQAVFDLLTEYDTGTTTYEQTVVTGVVSGDLLELPAGPLGVALGAEWRSFEIDDTPSEGSQNSLYWGTTSALVTRGEDTVSEIFAEVNVPLLRGLPLIEELTLDGSARGFEYDSYGSDSVWKAGLNWQIIPSLRIRGTKGTSYRAPALYELFLGNQTSFLPQTSVDPCIDWGNSSNPNIQANCAAIGIPSNYTGAGSSAEITTGGGFGVLEAETSEANTLGLIWTPSFIDLSIAIDYFDITINDQVAQLGAGTILGGCYGSPNFPNAFCNLFTRAPATDPSRPNQILTVNDSYINVNQQATHGIDYTIRYEHEFNFGDLVIDLTATQTMEDVNLLFDPNLASGFDTNDFLGTIGDPEWVADAQISLRQGDWTYSWFIDYIGATDNEPFFPEFLPGAPGPNYQGLPARRKNWADEWFGHDISVRWQGDDLTILGGVANVFDAQPPLVSNGVAFNRLGNAALQGTQYDLLGRTLFVRVGYKF